MMQTRKYYCEYMYCLYYWKTQNFSGKYNFLPLENCAEH